MQTTTRLFPSLTRADIVRIVATVLALQIAVALTLVLLSDYYLLNNRQEMWEYVWELVFLCIFTTTIVSVPTSLFALRLISRIIENRKTLEQEAHSDYLTGLLNRRAFETIARNQTGRQNLAGLLLIDADHFKRVNDTYGHDQGDAALIAIADALTDSVREGDVVGRVGGEEFAVLMTSGCPESALRLAERLRTRIEHLDLINPETGKRLQLTISIGVAFMGPDTVSFDRCYSAADQALYAAKQAGRNRVEVHDAQDWAA